MRDYHNKRIVIYNKLQEQEVTLKELYDAFGESDCEMSFSDWMHQALNLGNLDCYFYTIVSLEDYQRTRINERKDRIKNRVLEEYIHSQKKLSKADKKKLRKRYPETSEYKQACEAACQEDQTFNKLKDSLYIQKQYEEYQKERRDKAIEVLFHKLSQFLDELQQEAFRRIDLDAICWESKGEIVAYLQQEIDYKLRSQELILLQDDLGYYGYGYHNYYYNNDRTPLTRKTLRQYLHGFEENTEEVLADLLGEDMFLDGLIVRQLFQCNDTLRSVCMYSNPIVEFLDVYNQEISDYKYEVLDQLHLSRKHLLSCLAENPLYAGFAKQHYRSSKAKYDQQDREEMKQRRRLLEQSEREQILKRSIVSTIPDSYKDLYPLARQFKRHFVIHVGPTNSGKTYAAMQALRGKEAGIYLAPLRLLAYEQYENLNQDGYLCNLVTGEEKTKIPDAFYQSSTIEMADFKRHYPLAVIDEAQMLADDARGGAWTAAILGLFADEIHVCTAPYAVDLLKQLIEECEDSCEIIEHHRQTKLVAERYTFKFPESVQPKDALIVFSKKQVHAVASELQKLGYRCSIIYGNLPYDVRQEEARKFLSGETSVLVSTDAIGMGMNLPIQRIVFLETSKFDGKQRRESKPDEIQQIAGRAGRRGMYETGYVNSYENAKYIASVLQDTIPSITEAVVAFPESLLGLDASLSETLLRWDSIKPKEGYRREEIKEQIALCQELERYTDNKRLIYDFITIPFDSEDDILKDIWRSFFFDEYKGEEYNYKRFLPDLFGKTDPAYLNELEENYKICDLLYFYMDRFHAEADFQDIIDLKKEISHQIIKILAKQKLVTKKCRTCGKALPWNHRFPTCEACFRRGSRWK